MMIEPLGKRVLIKLESNDKVSTGGLVLASAAKEKPTQGEIIALGQLVSIEMRKINGTRYANAITQ